MLIVPRRLVSSYDADAQTYFTAVEAADGQSLESAVKDAINAFIVGCKTDGTWSAIKASCILAGARTLAGALVPLVGAAPTNVGGAFVSGDYNRKTGLLGNGSTKNLNSNRNNNADPQNSNHNAVYVTSAATGTSVYIGCGGSTTESGANNLGRATGLFFRNRNGTTTDVSGAAGATGFLGTSRSSSTTHDLRANRSTQQSTRTSQTPFNGNVFVFSTTSNNSRANARFSFYSIGESLNLALLDARLVTLMAALSAAIP